MNNEDLTPIPACTQQQTRPLCLSSLCLSENGVRPPVSPEQFQIGAVIVLLEERRLSPIPPLGHVVGDARNHNSR
jgi:hypothetical protein